MMLQMLKTKLHQACVTQADLHYEGSLAIDAALMQSVGLHNHEKILVANINNGARLETYAIEAPAGSREFVLNGAAARLGEVGDRIIIMSFAWVEEQEVTSGRFRARILRFNEFNEPVGGENVDLPGRAPAAG